MRIIDDMTVCATCGKYNCRNPKIGTYKASYVYGDKYWFYYFIKHQLFLKLSRKQDCRRNNGN